jgi:FAD/FMN-containing dehydrogenase
MRRMLRRHQATNFSEDLSGHFKFTDEQVRQFRKQLVGQVTLPLDATYPAARTTFMNAFQHFPQIIVNCVGFADVVCCIRFAQEVGLKPVCRSGGHSTAGYSMNDDMIIDVSGINYVRVDPEARVAWVGSGANFAQVNATLALYGLHVPGGGCETVGVAGYMQGGGYGFTSLMFGMNCDQVLGFRMALADGRIVEANAEENPDLFWAVRGGTGNNFGVLLEIEYHLTPLGPLWGFGFKWPLGTDQEAAAAGVALHAWHTNFAGDAAPKNLGNEALFGYTKGPDNKELAPYFLIRGMFNGSEAACRQALEPLFKAMPDAERYRDIWQSGTYAELNDYLLSFPTELPANVPPSTRAVAKSHIVGHYLTAEQCASIVEFYRASRNPDNFIGFEAYGGAVNAVPPNATAFWHRDAVMDVFLFSFWLYEDSRAAAEAYVSEFDRVLQPLSNGQSYQNYPNRRIEDFGNAYFGGNLPRLLDVKQAYDPNNFFIFPQGLDAAVIRR